MEHLGPALVALVVLALGLAGVWWWRRREGWRPIESVPSDTLVLAWQNIEPAQVYLTIFDADEADDPPPGFTHWRPLPDPPPVRVTEIGGE